MMTVNKLIAELEGLRDGLITGIDGSTPVVTKQCSFDNGSGSIYEEAMVDSVHVLDVSDPVTNSETVSCWVQMHTGNEKRVVEIL